MPTYRCAKCDEPIHSWHELTPGPNLLCRECYLEKHGDRHGTKIILLREQENYCIVRGCPYHLKDGSGDLHIHRIIPGKAGGKYVPENCVVVCPHHHKPLEGLTREQIGEVVCTEEQIDRMDPYYITETLLDYSFDWIAEEIEKLCKETFGVPARCDKYDIIKAIRRELHPVGEIL